MLLMRFYIVYQQESLNIVPYWEVIILEKRYPNIQYMIHMIMAVEKAESEYEKYRVIQD